MTTPARKGSLLTQLAAWLSFSLILVGAMAVVTGYLMATAPIRRHINQAATATSRKLADAISAAVWNLDDQAIAEYFEHYAPKMTDLVTVRVLTEFDDLIFTGRFSDETDTVFSRQGVYRGKDCIGYIEVALATRQLRLAQRAIMQATVITTLCAAGVTLLVVTILIRLIMIRPLQRLKEGLYRVAAGDYAYRLPSGRTTEVDSINQAANSMAASIADRTQQLENENRERRLAEAKLQALTDHLEEQVDERTRSLREAYENLQEETRERRQVQNEILAIGDRERKRIGRDLHDGLGQQLTGVSLLVAVLKKNLHAKGLPEAATADTIGAQLKTAISEARNISHGLATVDLAAGGLAVTLQGLISDTEEMYGISCRFEHNGACEVENDTVAAHIFRIVQEAIHNACRHGKATRIVVKLRKDGKDAPGGAVVIEDNGSGMPSSLPHSDGMGLRIMRFRAETVGGSLHISGNEWGGTTILATFEDKPVADERGTTNGTPAAGEAHS